MDINRNWVIETELDISDYKNLLLDTIKNTESSVIGKSTSGAMSKQYDIYHKYKEKPFISLQAKIVNYLKTILTTSNIIDSTKNLNLMASWIVEGKDYGYHQLHKHNKRVPHIATVIYLDIYTEDQLRNDEDFDGYFYYVVPENNEIVYKYIEPKENKMIIFPVWIWHGTYPQKKGRRTSLNLDFSIE